MKFSITRSWVQDLTLLSIVSPNHSTTPDDVEAHIHDQDGGRTRGQVGEAQMLQGGTTKGHLSIWGML